MTTVFVAGFHHETNTFAPSPGRADHVLYKVIRNSAKR
jgi:microcystin degradation protein MlrC